MKEIIERVPVVAGHPCFDTAQVTMSIHIGDLPAWGPIELLFCIHGGGYTRSYWNAAFEGFNDYSFAEYMTARGYVVVSIDMLGMGESSKPADAMPPFTCDTIAQAADEAAQFSVARVRDLLGERTRPISLTGIGHSLGGMMVTWQQANHGSFDRVAVLGMTNVPSRQVIDAMGMVEPVGYSPPQGSLLRGFFYDADVPESVMLADEAGAVATPNVMVHAAFTEGALAARSAQIRCPVFLAYASIDGSLTPHREPAYYGASDDVTLTVLRGSAHCHNLGRDRHKLWQRLDKWIKTFQA